MADELDKLDIITVGELRDILNDMPPNYKIVLASPIDKNEYYAISKTFCSNLVRPTHYTEQDIGINTAELVITLFLTDRDIIKTTMDEQDNKED